MKHALRPYGKNMFATMGAFFVKLVVDMLS